MSHTIIIKGHIEQSRIYIVLCTTYNIKIDKSRIKNAKYYTYTQRGINGETESALAPTPPKKISGIFSKISIIIALILIS